MSDVITEPAAPRSTRRWLGPTLMVLVLCLLGGTVAVAWWWTHPRLLVVQLLHGRSYAQPGEETYQLLAEVDPSGNDDVLRFSEVRIDWAATAVDASAAGAVRRPVAEVVVCVDDPSEDVALGNGSAADLQQYCSDVRPLLPGGRLDARKGAESLYLRLSTEARGQFELVGVELDYRRDGLLGQRGTQRLSADFAFDTLNRQ